MEQKGKEMNASRGHSGFDYESFRQETIAKMLSGDKELTGKDGLLAPLLKDLLDAALSGERQAHVEGNGPNRRNGGKSKTVKTGHGPVSVEMPRGRDGSFEPKLIAKRQTALGEGLDNRILSLYGKPGGRCRDVLRGHPGAFGGALRAGHQHGAALGHHR